MSLRVYLNPSRLDALNIGKYPSGCHYAVLEGGAKAILHADAGIFYFIHDMLSPINRKIVPAILKVTYVEVTDDRFLVASIARGFYKHGGFEAEVRSACANKGNPRIEICASAPTIPLMKRFIRQLMSCELKPKAPHGGWLNDAPPRPPVH